METKFDANDDLGHHHICQVWFPEANNITPDGRVSKIVNWLISSTWISNKYLPVFTIIKEIHDDIDFVEPWNFPSDQSDDDNYYAPPKQILQYGLKWSA